MRNLLFIIGTVIVIDLLLNSCANPGVPTGGPKDTIPPLLIHSVPRDQKLNFDHQTISLTFDEFVNADKIKQSLIITPITEIDYKVLYKKSTVTFKFEAPFEDSTTYTFNFFDGITDITEKNPAENLILAFSTGNYIDSIRIFGAVKNLFTGAPVEKMTVGLYRLTDSLDLFAQKPTYFTATQKNGVFQIQNIKLNNYKLFAFNDDNKNLLFDPATEAYAFKKDTLFLTETITDSLYLRALSIDASPLTLISARPTGLHFEVRYSKPITSYSTSFSDAEQILSSDFTNESASLRFYNNGLVPETDSLRAIISASDSLRNTRKDTIYVKFRESSRKPQEYTASLLPKSNSALEDQTKFKLTFSKPSVLLDSNFLFISIDTFYTIHLDAIHESFNFNNTSYSFMIKPHLQQFYTDTLQELTAAIVVDTLDLDTPSFLLKRKLESFPTNKINLNIKAGSFASVENDTSAALSATYNFSKPEDYGSIKLTINTQSPSFIVQLMSKDKVIREQPNCTDCTLSRVPPGSYWIRVLIDRDQDGKWNFGNVLNNTEPEPVIHFKEETSLRANWQVELNYSF